MEHNDYNCNNTHKHCNCNNNGYDLEFNYLLELPRDSVKINDELNNHRDDALSKSKCMSEKFDALNEKHVDCVHSKGNNCY